MNTAQIIAHKDKLILAKDEEILAKEVQLKQQAQKIDQLQLQLQHQYKELLRLIYGSKSERFIGSVDDESQLNLFEIEAGELKMAQKKYWQDTKAMYSATAIKYMIN